MRRFKIFHIGTAVALLSPARWSLLGLLLLCFLPIFAGTALYVGQWRPTQTGNHGQLVQPPRLMPEDFFDPSMQGRWLLVVAGSGACTEECLVWVRAIRAIQISLAKEMGRMRRVLLVDELPSVSAVAALDPSALTLWSLQKEQKDLLLLPWRTHWRAVFDVLEAGSQYQLYLIDPIGNVMMRYPATADPKGVRADLERLLRYSWTG